LTDSDPRQPKFIIFRVTDGGVVLADDTLFPGVIGAGSAILMGCLGPCGMVAPHLHPRTTEILVNIAGPPMMTWVIPEGGAP